MDKQARYQITRDELKKANDDFQLEKMKPKKSKNFLTTEMYEKLLKQCSKSTTD